jgi:hypothetical protein
MLDILGTSSFVFFTFEKSRSPNFLLAGLQQFTIAHHTPLNDKMRIFNLILVLAVATFTTVATLGTENEERKTGFVSRSGTDFEVRRV